ncbi:Sec-independent protein translocase protein TatB [Janthinobacterium agaricidamnosum]|uniref:Sec-independent protein translocase protein TatB n=1 Tax=Janthinobacterium agaricidamnosum NBRC 102515 = DSM 9628 TaxID=1349767 RepID=W0VDD7_9BURK|nr:Sec-independent protein translocase protein TatB [Janthinobacterium agaricidamnosum]CDG85317.1 twin arginine-targeting protein translocase TatB [Janthinobacterium agaricidamnosum NBRC 102515 = DSM 9628]
MFDFDISKMAVIGTVALVVLGPERLPRVARTLGTLLGRAQRYLHSVQAEVAEQIKLDELRKMKGDIEQEVANVQNMVDRTVRQHAGQLQAGVDAALDSVKEALPDNYLSSAHEAGIDLQAELFKVRPAALPVPEYGAEYADVPMQAPRRHALAPVPFTGQQARARWRGAVSSGRGAVAKRSRVVSMAASKSLGRGGGKLA